MKMKCVKENFCKQVHSLRVAIYAYLFNTYSRVYYSNFITYFLIKFDIYFAHIHIKSKYYPALLSYTDDYTFSLGSFI